MKADGWLIKIIYNIFVLISLYAMTMIGYQVFKIIDTAPLGKILLGLSMCIGGGGATLILAYLGLWTNKIETDLYPYITTKDAYHEAAKDVGFFYAAYALLGFAWAILFLEPDEDYSNSKFYAKADIDKIPKLTRFLVVTYIACFFLFLGIPLLYVIFR